MKNTSVRTRIAPSPTGFIHIGNLRTALYSYLFARQNDGDFIIRIEDTDRARLVEGAAKKILEMLTWSGLDWDEGPDKKSKFGPYIQSQRSELYKKYAQELIYNKKAYHCFCTPEDLQKMREQQQANGKPPRYEGECCNLPSEEVNKKLDKKTPHVIRLKVPDNETISFDDVVYGKITFNTKDIDHQVLIKSDGLPTYHLAVVVDDYLMKITHVIRGEDWLPSTPKHVMIYQALDWELPTYCHVPNILESNKKKLSKRSNAATVSEFKDLGYLPEALLNYIALLGWNPGTDQEIFSLKELIKQFDINKIHKAGAIFDIKKLDNINSHYIKDLKIKDLKKLVLPYLEKKFDLKKYTNKYIEAVISVEQPRLKKLSDITENTELFFTDKLKYDTELLIWKKSDAQGAKKSLELIMNFLEGLKKWDEKELEEKNLEFVADNNLTNGEVLWPLRVALSGQQYSPSPFEIASVLDKKETIQRIQTAIDRF